MDGSMESSRVSHKYCFILISDDPKINLASQQWRDSSWINLYATKIRAKTWMRDILNFEEFTVTEHAD